ncbi:Peptidase S8/S53 domain containing protein, partial [Naviculisporaceae sp. PSN 640]
MFNMAMQPVNIITIVEGLILSFFGIIDSQTDDVMRRLSSWVDSVDKTFLELYCYVDTEEGRKSRIWRSLTHQHHLHVGLNLIMSINRATHVNFIVKIIMTILQVLITGLRMRYLSMIGFWGEGLLALGQLSRGCNTNWTEPALRNPGEEPPEEGDEEDGDTLRFWIEGLKGTVPPQLWTVETVIGVPVGGVADDNEQGPWEFASKIMDGSVSPRLLVDLSTMQALMAKTALVAGMTITKMPSWDEFFSRAKDASPRLEDGIDRNLVVVGDHLGATSAAGPNRANTPNPPASSAPVVPNPPASSAPLPFISRPKGKDQKFDLYKYHSSRGKGTWIFFIDAGFTTAQYEVPGGELENREIREYVVPRQYTLPQIPTNPVGAQYYFPVPDSIEDNLWGETKGFREGHGMPMVSIAAGKKYGIASQANLYLIKVFGGAYQHNPAWAAPAMEHIYEQVTSIWGTSTGSWIDPTKSVICIAAWDEWRTKLDGLGMTFVFANTNRGFDPSTKKMIDYINDHPPVLNTIDKNSPAILVGGVYPDGSLAEVSAPMDPSKNDVEITIYGQAEKLASFVSGFGKVEEMDGLVGCSYASAQVAGLVAYFLGYPWPKGQNPFDSAASSSKGSVGTRMKEYLRSASYQRVPDVDLTQAARGPGGRLQGAPFPWNPPSWVNAAYNLAYGPQRCEAFPGLPAGRFALEDTKPDTCPVPVVTPGSNSTSAAPMPTAASTWTAEDAPTTLSWTVTNNDTTFVTAYTWAPTDSAGLSSLNLTSSGPMATMSTATAPTLTLPRITHS